MGHNSYALSRGCGVYLILNKLIGQTSRKTNRSCVAGPVRYTVNFTGSIPTITSLNRGERGIRYVERNQEYFLKRRIFFQFLIVVLTWRQLFV